MYTVVTISYRRETGLFFDNLQEVRGESEEQRLLGWPNISPCGSLADPTCEEGGGAKLQQAASANAGLTSVCEIRSADFCTTKKNEPRDEPTNRTEAAGFRLLSGDAVTVTRLGLCSPASWRELNQGATIVQFVPGLYQRVVERGLPCINMPLRNSLYCNGLWSVQHGIRPRNGDLEKLYPKPPLWGM